jgi:hypothetical protein
MWEVQSADFTDYAARPEGRRDRLGLKPFNERRSLSESVRGAADSIKSRTPAGPPGWGPRPGVERSGTPGSESTKSI